MQWPPPSELVLSGQSVTLRPAVADRDGPELFAALDDDRVWRHLSGRPSDAAGWASILREREGRGWLSWIVQLRVDQFGFAAGTAIGTSSYLEVGPGDARLEIGATAYSPATWGSRVNPETKLLRMRYAFDVLGAGRIQLKTDIRNERSAQAIARLGATFEGTLRRYQRRSDDSVRDTLLFSVIAEQWPQVRAGLDERIRASGEL
jgi:RimJ/RimL family protein N-acetyltransferase